MNTEKERGGQTQRQRQTEKETEKGRGNKTGRQTDGKKEEKTKLNEQLKRTKFCIQDIFQSLTFELLLDMDELHLKILSNVGNFHRRYGLPLHHQKWCLYMQ